MKRSLQKIGLLFILVLMTYAMIAQTVVYEEGTPKRPTAVNGLVVDGVAYNATFTYGLPIDGTRLSNGIELTEAKIRPFRDTLRNIFNRQGIESNLTFIAIVAGDNGDKVQLCYTADGDEGINDWFTDCLFPDGLPDFEITSGYAIADFELAEPKKYHVNATGGNDSNDGLSWTNAFATLQKAIETSVEEDSIWVAKGIYVPSVPFNPYGGPSTDEKEKTFLINKDIKLYGGFSGTEMTLSERDLTTGDTTFLDGLLSATDTAYNVVYIDGSYGKNITSAMIFDGFTVRNGRAESSTIPHGSGAGIYNDGSFGNCSPSIANVTFYDNTALVGGAIFNDGGGGISNPSIKNVVFYNNTAMYFGGAISNDGRGNGTCNPSIEHAVFYNNSARIGGGVHSFLSNPNIKNATFDNNLAKFGGAIYNDASSPSITNATFDNHSVELYGGAIFNLGGNLGGCSPIIINAIFSNNSARWGGAIYSDGKEDDTSHPRVENATFYNNSADSTGGAIYNYFADLTVSNSLFSTNKSNNVIDTVRADIDSVGENITTITYSLTQENSLFSAGTGILNNQNPQFVDAANGDFSLLNCSPAINAGTTPNPAIPMDIKGNARVGAYDMGAYEFQGTPVQITMSEPTVTQPTCETATGTIVINATATGNAALQYSVDDGATWHDNKTFSVQTVGSYTLKTRLKNSVSCEDVYTSNPVVLSAVTNCCPTMVNAGSDATVCNSSYTLQGTALQTGETGQWTFVDNPNDKGTLTNPTNPDAVVNANFDAEEIFETNVSQTFTLKWTVTNGSCAAGVSDEVTITLNPPVNAGDDRLAICGTTIDLGAAPASGGTGNWTFISNPNNSGSIDNASNPNATLTGVIGGSYELEWMVTGGACDGSMDRVMITFQPDSDNDTFQDCVDLCEGGDDRINTDNMGVPDDCDCDINDITNEFVTLDAASFITFINEQAGQDTARRIADFQLTATTTIIEATHPVVVFQASNSVTLQSGFHAKVGSQFIAEIAYCKDPLANPFSPEEQASSRTQRTNIEPNIGIIDMAVFPNPMKQAAAINLTLPTDMLVDLVLINQNGQLAKQYISGKAEVKGAHYYKLDASNLSSGLYFLQLRSKDGVITKKLVVQK